MMWTGNKIILRVALVLMYEKKSDDVKTKKRKNRQMHYWLIFNLQSRSTQLVVFGQCALLIMINI